MTRHASHHRGTPRSTLASARRTGVWAAVLATSVSSLAGCYATHPLTTAPVPGTTVVLDLNDRARVQLGDRIGPSAASIEGVVQPAGDSGYVINISSVKYLNGQTNQWSGERFTLSPTLVTQAWQREFSRSRTMSLGLGIAAAIAAIVLKTDFLSKTGGGQPTNPPPPTGGT
ncbi:MAG TPA: hypothetical protein VFN38_07465 [Gemmatimonadaceae bacterium]|nr:hypothetical protein [Gemmatimonadaceae bacterium]